MNQYNNQQWTAILNALLKHLKDEKNISQKKFCETHGIDENKLSRHRKEADERYNPENSSKYRVKICEIILQSYSLTFEVNTQKETFTIDAITVQTVLTEQFTYTVCRQDDKGNAAWVGYMCFNDTKQTVSYTVLIDNEIHTRTGEFQFFHNILSIFLHQEEAVSGFFCLNVGNSNFKHSPILRGTFSGVNKENNPMCCEVLLMKEKHEIAAKQKIQDNSISPILSHYFKNKRIQIDNSLINSLEELPTYKAFVEISRAEGDYLAFRLSDDGDVIRVTPARITADGRAFIKSRNEHVIYEGIAEIFMGKLLAINTFRNDEEPFHVLSIFMIGRLSKQEIKWLNGVLTGITSHSAMPRCSREIWVKSENAFENMIATNIPIPQHTDEMPGSEYEKINQQYNGLADFLRGAEDNLIVVAENSHKKFQREINYATLYSHAYLWAKSTQNLDLVELYHKKASEHGQNPENI